MGSSNSKARYAKPVVITAEDTNKSTLLEFSKQELDFNLKGEPCAPNQAITDEFHIKNISGKKLKYAIDPVVPSTVQLNFSPSRGSISKNGTVRVKVQCVLLARVNINFKITIKIEGGPSLFINMRVAGEAGVFGVDPSTLEFTTDGKYKIPVVLYQLKKKMLDMKGYKSEGIFRLAGDQLEIRQLKEKLNKKLEVTTDDVNALSSLIKIWFRELPKPILNSLSVSKIMNFSSSADCVEAYHNVPEPDKSLLAWLLRFLAQIASYSAENKMTAQNLAIVIAPNLYDISTPNPLEGLVLSQKCAVFVNHMLNAMISGALNDDHVSSEKKEIVVDTHDALPSHNARDHRKSKAVNMPIVVETESVQII